MHEKIKKGQYKKKKIIYFFINTTKRNVKLSLNDYFFKSL